MIYAETTRGELAELVPRITDADLREWCDLNSRGPVNQVIYVDGDTLSRCYAASSPQSTESNKSGKRGNLRGQRKPTVEPSVDAGEGSQDARNLGAGSSEPSAPPTSAE